jgi:hypothetical protein
MRVVNIPARQAAAQSNRPATQGVCVPVNQQRNCGCAFPADDPQRARLPRASQPDFTLHADGKIGMPSIEIDFRGSVVERCSISAFMVGDVKTLLDSFEMITLHMCAKNILPFAGMPMTIAPLSDDYKRAWRVRFAYGCYYADGQFTPCG